MVTESEFKDSIVLEQGAIVNVYGTNVVLESIDDHEAVIRVSGIETYLTGIDNGDFIWIGDNRFEAYVNDLVILEKTLDVDSKADANDHRSLKERLAGFAGDNSAILAALSNSGL